MRIGKVARAGVLAVILLLGACGGGSDSTATQLDATVGNPPTGDGAPSVPATTAPVESSTDGTGAPATDRPVPTLPPPEEPAPTPPAAESGATTPPAADTPTAPPAPSAAAIDLPMVEVVDLETGQTVDLTTFGRPGPTLVWFWAPH